MLLDDCFCKAFWNEYLLTVRRFLLYQKLAFASLCLSKSCFRPFVAKYVEFRIPLQFRLNAYCFLSSAYFHIALLNSLVIEYGIHDVI